ERWLEAQPAGCAGLWIKFAKAGSGLASVTKREAIDAALCHGWIDGQLDRYDDRHWLIRFTPRKARSKWSQVNRARATELLEAGRMRPGGLAQIEAAKADGRWEAAYAPASKAEVPADLQAALDRSPAAATFFATLTGANRYAILYRIGAVKKAETRARKIAEFVAMLERGETVHG
ncbi:MAG TPA: YdeI/OmpD-associated family protein, partial [Allosphingosinicella sp.]